MCPESALDLSASALRSKTGELAAKKRTGKREAEDSLSG